jgi:hypothetical protein
MTISFLYLPAAILTGGLLFRFIQWDVARRRRVRILAIQKFEERLRVVLGPPIL